MQDNPARESDAYHRMIPVVRNAWAAALAPLDCDFGQTWDESGGDSQAIVYLISGLEDALGRHVPYDMFVPEMTVADLAARLCDEPSREQVSRPTVFFVPGVYRSGPQVSEFARGFGDRIHFEVLTFADLADPDAILLSIPRMGQIVAGEIIARQPSGPILLAAHSYGGTIAFEAAGRLLELGREIALFAVLDTALTPLPETVVERNRSVPGASGLHVRQQLESRFRKLRWNVLWPLLQVQWRRRIAFKLLKRMSFKVHHRLRIKALCHMRDQSLAGWRPNPLPLHPNTSVLLFAGEQLAPANADKWQRLCGAPGVTILPGVHHDIIKNPRLVAEFERAVVAAWGQAEARKMTAIQADTCCC